MKKVKTIIASLIVIFASIFVSACSCGESNVPQVYVDDINIALVNEKFDEQNRKLVWSDTSQGKLIVHCRVGETFQLEYTLDPVDATFTQVNWEFSKTGLVKSVSGESYRKKSTKEKIDFKAVKRDGNNYTTTLTFTANITGGGKNGTEKEVKCDIIVEDVIEEQNTLSTPTNVHFNNSTNKIEWNKVNSLIDSNGKPLDSSNSSINMSDCLSGYEITFVDKDGNETKVGGAGYRENACAIPEEGKEYTVSVQALGTDTVNTSEMSEEYKFFKIKDVDSITNENGTVRFGSPDGAKSFNIYYYGVENKGYAYSTSLTTAIDGVNAISTTNFNKTPSNDQFKIQIEFLPSGSDADGHALIGGVHYFASTPKTTKVIQKLAVPEISLYTPTTSRDVSGVGFSGAYGDTKLKFAVKDYEGKYETKFEYKITDLNDNSKDPITGTTNNTQDYFSLLGNLTVGHYKIQVKTIGNSSETVESAYSNEFVFDITNEAQTDKFNYSLEDDVLQLSGLIGGGMEVFFVSTSSTSKNENSKRVVVPYTAGNPSVDISELGLKADTYELYVRHIPTNSNGHLAIISSVGQVATIDITNTLQNYKITSDGNIEFNKPSTERISQYTVAISVDGVRTITLDAVASGATGSQVEYTTSGDKISISLFDVARQIVISTAGTDVDINDEEQVDQLIMQYLYRSNIEKTLTCQVKAKVNSDSNGAGHETTQISSAFTTALEFSGASVVSTCVLEDYTLKFKLDGDKQFGFMVELIVSDEDDSTKYQFSHTGQWTKSGEYYIADLTKEICITDGDCKGKSLAELVDMTKDNYISVITLGRVGDGTQSAIVNTMTSKTKFGVANTPTDLRMDQNNKVYWKTTSNVSEAGKTYTYTIYLEVLDDEEFVSLRTLSKVRPQLGDGECYYDLSDVLGDNPDRVVSIHIVENEKGMFSSASSEKFYTTKISAPVLNYSMDESDNVISWEAIANAKNYKINVTKDGGEFGFAEKSIETLKFSISDMIEKQSWGVGVYTISIVACTDLVGSSSAENPYVISSAPAEKIVRIVSQNLAVAVSDNTISWNNICAGTDTKANYTITYNDTTLEDSQFDSNSTSYDIGSKLTARNNTITITPSISYVDTGFILIGDLNVNNVTKLSTPTALSATNGVLVFTVAGLQNSSSIGIELYQKDSDGSYKLVPVGDYTIADNPTKAESGDGYTYTLMLDGLPAGKDLDLKVRVTADNIISSDISSNLAKYKLATINNLDKSGNQLTWTTGDVGVNKFILTHWADGKENESKIIELSVEYKNGNYTCYVQRDDESVSEDQDKFACEKNSQGQYKFTYVFDESTFVGDNVGEIYITIRALAIDGYYNGNTSTAHTIIKLNTETEVKADNGVLSIEKYTTHESDETVHENDVPTKYTLSIYLLQEKEDAIEGEDNYERSSKHYKFENVAYDAGAGIANIDLNDLGLTDFGLYEIELQYIGDGNNILNSEVKTLRIEKLKISTLSTSAGQIAWDAVDSAEDYTLEISTAGEEPRSITISATPVDGKIIISESQLVYLDGEESKTYKIEASNRKQYTLKLRANGDDKFYSQWSETFTIRKLLAPTQVSIRTNVSEDLTIEEESYDVGTPIITWIDGNVNNSQFKYELLYGTTENMVTINPTTDKKYVLRRDLEVGDYKLLLRVVGNDTTESSNIGLLTSDYYENSNTVAKYIQDVDGIKVENGTISWTDIVQAYAYKVSAYSAGTLQFVVYSHTNSINFSDFSMGDENNQDGGTFQFVVNAITDPRDAIVTSAGEETKNSATIFKPNTLSNFRVKNGQLNWRISISDINGLVSDNMDKLKDRFETNIQSSELITTAVIKYVLGVINDPTYEQNEELNEILTYLLKVRLNINSIELEDTPTSVMVVDNDGKEVTDPTKYLLDGKYLEYSYEVSIEPTISDISSDSDGDDGDEEVEGSGDGEENEEDIATQAIETPAVEYTAGKYTIRISTVGNSSADLPIVSGGYTTTLTAYKPNAPVTWKSGSGDITEGRVQWNLSTTPEADVDGFKYHQDYKISAVRIEKGELENKAYKIVSVSDTESNGTNQNLSNGYQYYRDLKDDLFTTTGDANDTNVLLRDKEYRLLINVIGTADSMAEDAGDYIYLNSNACVVASHVNFLSETSDTKVESNTLSWVHSTGSTMTRVFIYGPFDTVDEDNENYRDIDWKETTHNSNKLETIYNAYMKENNGEYEESKLNAYSADEIKELAKQLVIYDFRDEKDGRKSTYTLTDDKNFAPGGYRIFFQEIGDGHGVLDSEQTNYSQALAVEKLATPEVQTTGWIGTKDSKIYVRDYSENVKDGWTTTTAYDKDPLPSKVGTFVWNCVAGANAYKVDLYRNDETKPCAQVYTRKTMYEPSDTLECNAGDTFYIKVWAVRVADESDETQTVTYASNFFYSDEMEVSGDGYERLESPVDMKIYSDGTIKWNIDTTENTNIDGYYVRLGYGNNVKVLELTTNQGSISGVFDFKMSETVNGVGDIVISLKTMASNEKEILNSGYGTSYQVHCLADPNARVQEGVFNWGWTNGDTIVDPLTDSQLTVDTKTTTIPVSKLETFYTYYTDILEHNAKYESSNDEKTYAVGEHTFKVKFLGSGGDGTELDLEKDDQYIASNEKTLTANKLSAPDIENVQLKLADSETENMVQWKKIDNAQGYRVRVFVRGAEDYQDYKISLDKLEENDPESLFATYGGDAGNYTYVQFKLNSVIERFINAENGGELYIYVQALGTEDSTKHENGTLYLSSSYSTSVTVGTPPCPQVQGFSGDTGLLEWNFGDNEVGAYGIKLKTEYTVSGVTSDELNTYWIASAKEYALGNAEYTTNVPTYTPETLSGVLQKRSIRYTKQSNGETYDVEVVDMLYLKETGTTPTSYKVTTIASNYKFEITAIAFNSGESSDDSGFTSPTVTYNADTAFSAFGKGDGGSKYVYTIANYTQLNRIRNFADRAFVLTSDIDMTDTTISNDGNAWNMVTEDFTGSLDGNNKTITLNKIEGEGNSDYTEKDYALFNSNRGTIKDLKVRVSINESGTLQKVSMAVIAVENSGAIDNVTIEGSIILTNNGSHSYGSERIAGIAVENTGTIRNSTVSATIVATSNQDVYGGGIVAENNGSIYGCIFSGSITANQVGGISAENNGTIERSYSTENAVINATDATLSGSVPSSAGGISARMNGGSIKYSYSLATIYINKQSTNESASTTVGGLVGAIDKDADVTITITGNYVVSKIYLANGATSKGSIYKYDILPMSGSESYASNYYIVETKEGETSITSSKESNGGTACDDLDDLKEKLATIKDGENSVYITTGDGYPTLATKTIN